MHRPMPATVIALLVLLAIVLGAPAARAAEEFHVYLAPSLPDTFEVEIGTEFVIQLEVDSTAHQFNGYEVTIQYDPQVVEFLQVQEGPLFTENCPNRFTFPSYTDSTVTYAHVILCAGVSLDGPGVCSLYRFRADSVGISPMRLVSDPDRSFYDAGLYIWPNHPTYPRQVIFHDAVVKVYDPTVSAPEPAVPTAGGALDLRILPNPVFERALFRFRLDEATPTVIDVLDAAGRRIERLDPGILPPGIHDIAWDGPGGRQGRLAAGVYFCRIHAGGATRAHRFVVIR